jgi:hypothetical protein
MFIGVISNINASDANELHDVLKDYEYLPNVIICGNALKKPGSYSNNVEIMRSVSADLNIANLIVIPGISDELQPYIYDCPPSFINYCSYGPGPSTDQAYIDKINSLQQRTRLGLITDRWLLNNINNPVFSFFNPLPIDKDKRSYSSMFLDLNKDRKQPIKRWIFGDSDITINEVRHGVELYANPFNSPDYKPLILAL